MKKIYYIIPSLVFFSLCFNSCFLDNRELDDDSIIEDFPFEFTVEAPETIFWKSMDEMQVELYNEHQVDGQTFKVTWELRGKEGKLYYHNEEVNEFQLPKGKDIIGYLPLDKGDYSMTFLCQNGNPEYDIEQVVDFTVIDRPFKASVSADRYTFYQSETEPIKVRITVDEPDWVDYEYSYTSEQENQLTTSSGEIVEENKKYSLFENYEIELLFDPLGNNGKHTFFVHFYDTQGQEIIEEISFDVKSIDIGLTLDYTSELDKEVYYTEKSNLKFGLNPVFEDPNKVNYTAKAVIQDATGLLHVNGNTYQNGETFDIEIGNLNFSFEPTTEDYKDTTAKVGLLISDNYGNSEEITLPIKVEIIDFNFELTKKVEEIFFNETAEMHLDFENQYNVPHASQPKYTVTYTVSGGEGTININGNIYTDGQTFEIVSPTNTDFTYKPTKYQNSSNTITFKIEDQYGTVHEKSISVSIKQRVFDFTAINNGETLYLGANEPKGKINCNIVVQGNSNGMTYFVQPKSNGQGTFYYKGVEYSNNAIIEVQSGVFDLEYKPSSFGNGTHTINIETSDNTEQVKSQSVSFDIYKETEVNTLSLVRTPQEKHDCGGIFDNDCTWLSKYYISYDVNTQDNIPLKKIIISGYSSWQGKIVEKTIDTIISNSEDYLKIFEEKNGDPDETWSEGDILTVTFIDYDNREIQMTETLIEVPSVPSN